MHIRRFSSALLAASVLIVNASSSAKDFAWFDKNLKPQERTEALISAMTVEEKISQLLDQSKAIPRLGIPEYNWWNECLHGVARNGRSTVFPQAIAFGASFDPELVERIGTAISDEARAKFVVSQKAGNRSRYAGLTFWSPNVNIFRDPRWGRGQETYGEDPYLTSQIGVSFVKGLQGDNPNYLKVSACAKHYAVHSGPEELRHEFDAFATQRDLWETYLPAFKALVTEAKVESVMGAYNAYLGEPCCSNDLLLKDILRDQWGFDGHVVSDCGAVQDIWKFHKTVETPEEAAAIAIKAGTDVNCGSTYHHLDKALSKGLVSESDIDVALSRLLRTKIKLGLLDELEDNPYNAIPSSVVGSEKHRNLAKEAAAKSVVLVKNKNNVLPLEKDIRTLYVVGPNASSEECLLGNYYGITDQSTTILDGIVGKVSLGTSINYKIGILPFSKNVNPIDWTTGESKGSEVCIAVLGIDGRWEGEEGEAIASPNKGDKTNSIRLPQNQIDFVKKLSKDAERPLVVVITGGSPIAIPEIYELADAVIYAWYPGQEGGAAIGDVIFGDTNPSGRLPFTVPYSIKDLPPYEDYAMQGRTYKYMKKEPLFPFGFGLSYASFDYKTLELEKKMINSTEPLKVSVIIENESEIDGDEVIQLYLTQPGAGKTAPLKKLVAFKKSFVKAQSVKKVSFEIDPEHFVQYTETGEPVVIPGAYMITVGGSSPGDRSIELGAPQSLSKSFAIKVI